MAVNIPQGWVADQALVPEGPVDLYDQDRPYYTVAWPQGHAPTGGAVIAVLWTSGSNYPDGSYTGVATTGGHGTGGVGDTRSHAVGTSTHTQRAECALSHVV